jgi:hypothetical protein
LEQCLINLDLYVYNSRNKKDKNMQKYVLKSPVSELSNDVLVVKKYSLLAEILNIL